MLSKEEIETCKKEARNYIEFMETTGDNTGWIRGLLWHIGQLETKTKELGKGQQELIKSRRKWKKRYYKIKIKNKDLQQSVDQIYDDYQDIGKMAFDCSDKIDQLESDKQKLIEKLEKDIREETGYARWTNSYTKEISPAVTKMISKSKYAQEILSILKGE